MSLTINTVKSFNETRFKEKGSEFIGQVYPIIQDSDSEEILHKIRKEHYNANHHCYAHKIYQKEAKYSDDGEPSGTAGIRILNAITHFDLENVLVVVIRYFGGIKLGVGPLGKAYYYSAYSTLESASIIKLTEFNRIKLNFDYDFISNVHHILAVNSCKITDNTFENNKPAVEFLARSDISSRLKDELNEASKGTLSFSLVESLFLRTKS